MAGEADEDEESDDEGAKRDVKMVENPHLKAYREHFLKNTLEGDRNFLVKLCKDIYLNGNLARPASRGKRARALGNLIFKDAINSSDIKVLARIIINSSMRLRSMFAGIANQLDICDEKALIFASNP